MKSLGHVLELLPDLVAGHLTAKDANPVHDHLRVCALCANRLNELRSLTNGLRTLPAGSLDPSRLIRIAALARAKRVEVLDRRQQHWLATLILLSTGLFYFLSVVILSKISEWLSTWWHCSPGWALMAGVIGWGVFCWMMSLSLVPILKTPKVNGKERFL